MEGRRFYRCIGGPVIDIENMLTTTSGWSDSFDDELIIFDPNEEDSNGRSRLIAAILDNKIESVELLLGEPSINPNSEFANGWTALMTAVQGENYKMVELLLKHQDTDVNTQDRDGFSALYFAIVSGDVNIVKILLTYGANPAEMSQPDDIKISKKNIKILQNWKSYLPEWTHNCSTAIYYPFEFKELAILWLLICTRMKPTFPKDIKYLILVYLAKGWKSK